MRSIGNVPVALTGTVSGLASVVLTFLLLPLFPPTALASAILCARSLVFSTSSRAVVLTVLFPAVAGGVRLGRFLSA